MYPVEANFTTAEFEIIFRIRQLINDEKELFVDDLTVSPINSNRIKVNGSFYELEEPKGYPKEIYINGSEIIATSGYNSVNILSYKFLQFIPPSGSTTGPLNIGTELTVIYDHFRNSDLEILDTYDTSAYTYLVNQCGLDEVGAIPVDLLVLATAYILLTKDLHRLASEAIEIRDSDSEFRSAGSTGGARYIMDLLKLISNQLLDALRIKMRCKMMSLPVYVVE